MYYIGNFTIKKCKKWYKITALNGFNDYVFIKNENEIRKLYKISNEYHISRNKQDIINYIKNN